MEPKTGKVAAKKSRIADPSTGGNKGTFDLGSSRGGSLVPVHLHPHVSNLESALAARHPAKQVRGLAGWPERMPTCCEEPPPDQSIVLPHPA